MSLGRRLVHLHLIVIFSPTLPTPLSDQHTYPPIKNTKPVLHRKISDNPFLLGRFDLHKGGKSSERLEKYWDDVSELSDLGFLGRIPKTLVRCIQLALMSASRALGRTFLSHKQGQLSDSIHKLELWFYESYKGELDALDANEAPTPSIFTRPTHLRKRTVDEEDGK